MSIALKCRPHLNVILCQCIKYRLCSINTRSIRHSHMQKEEDNLDALNKEVQKIKPFNENEDHIWVSPPHPVSNLRLKVFPSSKRLTKEESHFYEKSKEIQEWSQKYWESHNKDFEESKKAYIEKVSKERKSEISNLSVEEMADFYKEFLNKNYKKHVSYNCLVCFKATNNVRRCVFAFTEIINCVY